MELFGVKLTCDR